MSQYRFTEVLYQCITPLHVGCGQDVGVVDLPVIRERTTDWPFIPGSGIRGSLRSHAEEKLSAQGAAEAGATEGATGTTPAAQQEIAREPKNLVDRLFGRDKGGQISSGCVSVLDARLLLFPVRSAPGPFRWITCPFALERYREDRDFFLAADAASPEIPSQMSEDQCYGATEAALFLEEFPFTGNPAAAWRTPVQPLLPRGIDANRVVLVADEVFLYFVRFATIVTQHNRLTSAKTVDGGGLFSVESVPPETVFYGFVGATKERTKSNGLSQENAARELKDLVLPGRESKHSDESHVILGGDESTGLGVTRLTWRG
ncbi:MAG: type III-B CRISPR module RAMP protein Cmr4 [Thermoanaerobaculia bacterium]|nr:type III-B CRISPR module RAMP protein Cmr4 [Thermoanaerobaculia bacterium]